MFSVNCISIQQMWSPLFSKYNRCRYISKTYKSWSNLLTFKKQRTALKGTISEVVPDAIFDFTHNETGDIYDKGGYVEVKATNETLNLQSSKHQIIDLIDATSKLPIAKKGGTPALIFVTTHDTGINKEVKSKATLQNVALYQYKAYIDDRNRTCLTSPSWLNSFETKNKTSFLEPYWKVRCSDLLPPAQVNPYDPDPAELSLTKVFYHSNS